VSLLAVPHGRPWLKRDRPRRAAQPELLGVVLAALRLHEGELARLAHARSSDVFPLPAGAEMIVTFRAAARSRAATRSPLPISRGVA
jgi:hypothetical protein